MKYMAFTLLIVCVLSCKSKKNNNTQTLDLASVELTSDCPTAKDVSCKVDLIKHKSIVYNTEKSTGKLQKELVDNETSNVIVFQIKNHPDKAITDAQYREEILFEVPKTKSQIDLTDGELRQINMTFGRFCFCERSKVGYFKIDKGHLKIKDGQIELKFQTDGIPQVIKSVSASYKLKDEVR